jgi:hypothetical protein
METGGDFDLTKIAHFNGGLFDGRRALPLDAGDIGLLIAAGSLDWSLIDPSIFGTLFERFLDPEKRGQIGAHYTDAEKIMMIVNPVVVQPLREEWVAAKTKIEKLVEEAHLKTGQAYRNAVTKAEEARSQFLERLRKVTILDPACGSGNFLYLALQAVKDIELRANLECEAMGLEPRAPAIGPEIVKGIEINPLAAELARTTIWIGDIQWSLRNAIYGRPDPILRKLETIECRDAVLTRKPDGDFEEAKWPPSEFIVGWGGNCCEQSSATKLLMLFFGFTTAAFRKRPTWWCIGLKRRERRSSQNEAHASDLLLRTRSEAEQTAACWIVLFRKIVFLKLGAMKHG